MTTPQSYVRTTLIEVSRAVKAEFLGASDESQMARVIRWPASEETPYESHRNAAIALVGPGWTVECSEAPEMGVLVWPVYEAEGIEDVADADNIPPSQQPVE